MILEYESGSITASLARSQKVLVNHVSFQLTTGETLALIGETGSGKTMIALSIMKLLPANVKMHGGKLNFAGRDLLATRNLKKILGVEIVYIPQNGLEFLNPSKRVMYHLYDSLKKLGLRGKEVEETALQKLRLVGFSNPEEIMVKYPFQLSGGMAQRVTIAIAACSRAKLVIADEPTNGLDQEAKVQFMETLKKLFPKAAKLIITHDIAVAELCEKTLVLCGGNMMEKGPSTEILGAPRQPYTKALIAALVKNGMHPTPTLRPDSGACPFFRKCADCMEQCKHEMAHHIAGDREWWCNQSL